MFRRRKKWIQVWNVGHVFSISKKTIKMNQHEQSCYLAERWTDCHQCVQILLFPSSVDASGIGRYPRGNCEPPCALWLLSLAQRWSIYTKDPGGIQTQHCHLHSSTSWEKLEYLKITHLGKFKTSHKSITNRNCNFEWCLGGHMLLGEICVLRCCAFQKL